jgi:hypothetical protein
MNVKKHARLVETFRGLKPEHRQEAIERAAVYGMPVIAWLDTIEGAGWQIRVHVGCIVDVFERRVNAWLERLEAKLAARRVPTSTVPKLEGDDDGIRPRGSR